MKRLGSSPVSTRAFMCPQCEKLRMTRLPDHVVSLEKRDYKLPSGKTINLFVDICEYCKNNNYKRHFEPNIADVRRLMYAIKGEQNIEGQSLENLL